MAQPGTLTTDDADVEQPSTLSFDYAVDSAHVSDTNWVGIFAASGGGPGEVSSPAWTYAPGASGTAEIPTALLSSGPYRAYYLYDDGYDVLAGPLPVAVHPAPSLPTPTYVGQFGRRLKAPAGLARDDRGGFWVADPPSHSVHHYDGKGRLKRIIGDEVLRRPQDVAIADNRVYVVDSARHRVDVFTRSGRHTGSIGTSALQRPRGIEVVGSRLLVSDVGHNRVARFDLGSGRLVDSITESVHIPHGIVADGSQTWVVSSSRQYDGNCGVTSYTGTTPGITLGYGQHSVFGALSNPAHVAVDAAGIVLVTVPDYGFVSRFRPTGAFVGEFGTSGPGLLRYPQGVVADDDGRVYVADTGNRRIAIFQEKQ